MSDKTFYVTTPIYYVNARPHIGHAYTTIVADVLARRHRLLGEDTFFLTGTDEHGQKIERSAAAAGIPPQQFADQVSKSFQDLWHRMGILRDTGDPLYQQDYIRTTDPRHKRGVQHLFSELYKNGFIYLSTYTGAYCVSDEAFVDAPVGTPCPDCGRLLEQVTEENFFFKLSAFQKPLLDLIESNQLCITPDSRRNEVLSFLKGNIQFVLARTNEELGLDPDTLVEPEGMFEEAYKKGLLGKTQDGDYYAPDALRDLSISRSSFTWGIPVPEDVQREAGATKNHVIYVWLDALANYITALGYGSDDETLFKKFWPANLHLVGKEIIRFHCVYWPAFLLALNPAYNTAIENEPNPNPVILSEARSAQSKDPDTANPTTTDNTFSTSNAGTQGPQLTFDQHKTWAEKWLPKAVTAHGWLLFEDSKMSKSKGNIVRTETILEGFGTLCPPPASPSPSPSLGLSSFAEGGGSASPAEPQSSSESTNRRGTASAVPENTSTEDGASAPEVRLATQHDRDLFASDILRYFLLREIPFGQDGSFSFDAMITRYNADLANGYGNLVSRTLSMIQQYFDGEYQNYKTDFYFDWVQNPGTPNHLWLSFGDITAFRKDSTAQKRAGDQEPGDSLSQAIETFVYDCQFSQATETLMQAVTVVDGYLTHNAPWKLAKQEEAREKLAEVLMNAAEAIRYITACAYDILPYTTAKVWAQLGLGDIKAAARNGELTNLEWGGLKPGTKLGPLSPIFPRADKGLAQIMTDMENPTPVDTTPADPAAVQPTPTSDPAAPPRTSSLNEPITTLPVGGSTAFTTGPDPTHPAPTPAASTPAPAAEASAITIDDFAKIELRVAEIKLAERIPKADKLLRLEVDLGPLGQRQILSGIAEHYAPEDLIGRRIIVITNLAPRKMRGLESHGMLLAASEENGKPYLATVPEGVPVGTRLK